jgi:hypothetical protein
METANKTFNKIADLARECRKHLIHPTPPNIDSVRQKLSKILRLCTKPNGTTKASTGGENQTRSGPPAERAWSRR